MRLKARVRSLEQQFGISEQLLSEETPSDFDAAPFLREFWDKPLHSRTPEEKYAELCAMKPPVRGRSKMYALEAAIHGWNMEHKETLEREYGFSEAKLKRTPGT